MPEVSSRAQSSTATSDLALGMTNERTRRIARPATCVSYVSALVCQQGRTCAADSWFVSRNALVRSTGACRQLAAARAVVPGHSALGCTVCDADCLRGP